MHSVYRLLRHDQHLGLAEGVAGATRGRGEVRRRVASSRPDVLIGPASLPCRPLSPLLLHPQPPSPPPQEDGPRASQPGTMYLHLLHTR